MIQDSLVQFTKLVWAWGSFVRQGDRAAFYRVPFLGTAVPDENAKGVYLGSRGDLQVSRHGAGLSGQDATGGGGEGRADLIFARVVIRRVQVSPPLHVPSICSSAAFSCWFTLRW